LENLHLGKPIPRYIIENENLIFTGYWEVPVMSDSEPLFFTRVKLEDDGQYSNAGGGASKLAEIIHNYEHKDLLIGILGVRPNTISGWNYLIIRKDNKDIFVKSYDDATGKVSKTEYSLNEIINLLKK